MEALVERLSANPDPAFWRGRRVAVTGHTGFKGAILVHFLLRLGAKVSAFSLAPHTTPNLFDELALHHRCASQIGDLREFETLNNWLLESQPEVVFHLAAQALVRESYRQPAATMSSNFVGTLHLLEALRQQSSVKAVVCVTTDKVYRQSEIAHAFSENDALGGHDPYSASKAACEILIESYRLSFLQHASIATARAGNVIGGGDWSAERLLPDAVRAWQLDDVLEIRSPDAIRPWQHVLEALTAYLILAEKLFASECESRAYNFGPDARDAVSVRRVLDLARQYFGRGEIVVHSDLASFHEAQVLMLNTDLARTQLGIAPRWTLETAVARSMLWYRQFARGVSAARLCDEDIAAFLSDTQIHEHEQAGMQANEVRDG